MNGFLFQMKYIKKYIKRAILNVQGCKTVTNILRVE